MQAVKLTKDHPELQLPQWKTFNPDKLIHLRGTLEKRGLSQALTRKGGGNVIFPSLQFLGTRVKHSGTPPLAAESTNGVLVKLTKWVKGENSYQSPLRSLLCCPMEKKVRFLHVVPSFPNADGLAKTFVRIRALNCDSCLSYQVPTGGDPFSQGQLCLLLYGGPENLAQQHSVWWPPNMARLKDELCPIFSQIWMDSWGPTDCCQLSGELSESLSISGSGSWEGNFHCTLLGMPLAFKCLFNTANNIYRLSQPKPDKIFGSFFVFVFPFIIVALGSEVGQIGNRYLEPDSKFVRSVRS